MYHNHNHKKLWKAFLVNFLLLVSSWVCFAGDNLQNFTKENDKIRISSVTLLFIGLTGFRLIPFLRDELDENQNEDRNDDYPLHQTIINMLHLIPEIDGWFTQVTALIALAETSYNGSAVYNGNDSSTCAAGYIGSMWAIYVFILIVSAILTIIALIRYYRLTNRRNLFKFILYIFMWLMVMFFLIGDNSQPLDCTISSGSSNEIVKNAVRIVFIILSLVPYIIFVILCTKDWRQSNAIHPTTN